jgi:nitrite reductase (cytochrome c-552)
MKSISQLIENRNWMARLLASKGFNQEVPYPDISTKAKAQELIGLDMKKLREEKEAFKKNLRRQRLLRFQIVVPNQT